MDNWENIFKQMLTEKEEEPKPSKTVDDLDDLLFKLVVSMDTLLNGKDDGKQDEQAMNFIETLDSLADGRFRSKFNKINKKADKLDNMETGEKTTRTRQALLSIFKSIRDAKNQEKKDQDNKGE